MIGNTRSAPSTPLRVWLVTVGEPLPTDPGPPRMLRVGMLASQMHRRGLDVTWWTSTFDHQRKVVREGVQRSTRSPEGYRIELLDGVAYASSVSLARIRNHRQTAAQFSIRAAHSPRPDVILCSYPTIELCEAAIGYGRRHGVPVVLDIRDLWPDIFLSLIPAGLRPVGRLALAGMFRASQRACSGATAIIGITETFVDWGLNRAGRARNRWDLTVPLAYEAKAPPDAKLDRARRDWDEAGVRGDSFNLCFFGTLGRQFDIPTVLEAARRLQGSQVRFVLCGDGDRLAEFRKAAAGLPNVLMPGWVDAAAIRALMERSAAGLAPYYCETSFTMSIPNKAIEYMADGLPLLSSLRGELETLLRDAACGLTWAEGDAGSLVESVEWLRMNPELRRQMGSNSSLVYRTRFVAEVVYGQLIDHLCEVARACKGRTKSDALLIHGANAKRS